VTGCVVHVYVDVLYYGRHKGVKGGWVDIGKVAVAAVVVVVMVGGRH
jgi:hypothetical protein